MINTASSEVRRISHDMAPSALRLGSLKDALSDLARNTSTDELQVTFEWLGDEEPMAEKTQVMLFRMAQELISNVVKHAKASTLLVQVNRYDGTLTLVVEDNGHGFDPATKADGLGLRSIRSRADFLGATLDIDTKIGHGTTATIILIDNRGGHS